MSAQTVTTDSRPWINNADWNQVLQRTHQSITTFPDLHSTNVPFMYHLCSIYVPLIFLFYYMWERQTVQMSIDQSLSNPKNIETNTIIHSSYQFGVIRDDEDALVLQLHSSTALSPSSSPTPLFPSASSLED